MNAHDNASDDLSNAAPDQDLDNLYEAMLPRLAVARRRYIHRRLGAMLVIVPVLLGATLAFARPSDDPGVSQLANGGAAATETEEEVEPTKDETDEEPAEEATEAAEADAARDEESDEPPAPVFEPVSLGMAGTAFVAETDDGLKLGDLDLNDGWDADKLAIGNGNAIVLLLTNGDIKLTATVFVDGEGEPRAKLDDVSPEPEPDVQLRKEIAVGDVGTVVVERDGDKLWLAVTWSHQWWKDVVVVEHGKEVHGYFTNDGIEKHVRAWIKGDKIKHDTWVDDSGAEKPKDEPKEEPKDEPKEEPKEEPKDEVQRRKEIAVGEVGTVVVEREGKKLWLGVTWSHQWWDDVVVVEHGKEVHAYFTNDGFEKHVRAWIKGDKIKHETWLVEPEVTAYDGWVSCGFGDIGVLVEGNIARVMTVTEVEGVETDVLTEVGEVVRIRFSSDEGTFILEAWGNGEEVVSECGPVE